MLPSSSLSAKDQLRRSKSTRSIRRNHRSSFSSEPFDPDLARLQATAAASQAMRRSNERSSMESKRSYDRLGGPENLSVPSRRRPVENPSVRGDDEEGSSLSAACYVQNQDTYPAALGPSMSSVGWMVVCRRCHRRIVGCERQGLCFPPDSRLCHDCQKVSLLRLLAVVLGLLRRVKRPRLRLHGCRVHCDALCLSCEVVESSRPGQSDTHRARMHLSSWPVLSFHGAANRH